MNRLKFQIAFLLFITIQPAFVSGQGNAGQPGAFLRYGVGGRALGMGRAFTAVSNDASGIYWNPAGIMGVKRIEFHSMYSNLYYDSQFAFMGLVVPRPFSETESSFLNTLFGENSSIGIGWVGLSMVNFTQRTHWGHDLDHFSFQENALILAYAREFAGSLGILKTGFNLKVMRQEYPNLQAASNFSSDPKEVAFGGDFGMIFQPINAPLFNIISLKYLLPLQLGISVQNLVRPGWKTADGNRDKFPVILRTGASYRLIFKDWIPQSWEGLHRITEDCSILLVYDFEFIKESQTGRYFGFEGHIPVASGFDFFPRMGWNNQTEGISLGMGINLPFTEKAVIRIDYSNTNHQMLQADNRFFITLQTNKIFDAAFFNERAQNDLSPEQKRKYYYRVLADYPNRFVKNSAEQLAALEDSAMVSRYLELMGGKGWAEWLFKDAQRAMHEEQFSRAQKLASEAAHQYTALYTESPQALNNTELMNYAETLLIIGQPENALSVLSGIQDSTIRMLYLTGISQKGIADWDRASKTFTKAVLSVLADSTQRELIRRGEFNHLRGDRDSFGQPPGLIEDDKDPYSMVALSFMGIAKSLIRLEQYSSAVRVLNAIVEKYQRPLHDKYPRYPVYYDKYIVDDAQYLLGLCRILEYTENIEDGVDAVLQTGRFFNSLEYGQTVFNKVQPIWIKYLKAGESTEIINEAKEMIDVYFDNHKWPVMQ